VAALLAASAVALLRLIVLLAYVWSNIQHCENLQYQQQYQLQRQQQEVSHMCLYLRS
jgi:hypothetical protein